MYIVTFTDDGLADVKALPKNVRNSLKKEIQRLASDPSGCSNPLREPLAGWRRFQSGKYRIIFRMYPDLKAIAIAAVGKHDADARKDVYRRLESLAADGKLAEKLMAVMREFPNRGD